MYTVPLPGLVALVLTAGACARHPDGVTPAPDFPTTADAVDCARAALADAGFHPQTSSDAPTPTSISGRIVSGRKWDRVTANAHVRTSAQGDTTVVLTVTATPANLDGPAAVFLESTVVTVALPALGRDFGSMPPVHIIGSWACPAPARLRAPTRPGSFSPAPPRKYPTTLSPTTEAPVRRFAIGCCAVVLVGCTKSKEEPAMDTTAAAPAVPAPAPLSLADVAGKWAVRTMPESGDSTLLSYEIVAGADTSGWSFNFPNRKPVPIRVVAVAGDSIVTEAGPFESLLRKGVQVSVVNVIRLQDGKLLGATTARYATSGPDSVAHLRFEGTRAP